MSGGISNDGVMGDRITTHAGEHFLPEVLTLHPAPEFERAFAAFTSRPHCLVLDSARRHPTLGRYSYFMADPFQVVAAAVDEPEVLAKLASAMQPFHATHHPLATPFQGGAAGLLSYDLGRSLERLPSSRWDEFQLPAVLVGLYDVVLAIDHQENAGYLISQGFPEHEPARRRERAKRRLAEVLSWIDQPTAPIPAPSADADAVLPIDALAPQFTTTDPRVTSNFAREDYLAAVARGIEYIRSGDIFQVNLSQRLLAPATCSAVELYRRLRSRNAATFGGYFDLGCAQICSASPERFLAVQDGLVEARPIKGTRQRTKHPEADLFAGDVLKASAKDRAENVMIVDLMRNDLSRVCRADSVGVTQLCELESYEYVQHLVSAIQGTLADGRGIIDLLRAAFPGGSITGAPKIRAMEIIAELEPTARGAYCGSLAYWGFDGYFDSNILIRTITQSRGWWQAPVGGGIVADSVPEAEYAETWHKAEGLLRALSP